MEYIVVFMDCFSRFTILVPARDHTASTVCQALLERVIPYFGVPQKLLSDRGREFTGRIWEELLEKLHNKRVLTSPYHPEGNAINESSHRTIGNIMRALQQEGQATDEWVKLLPAIMLTLNSMPHGEHNFSASMVATGRENLLPPDLATSPSPSPLPDNPASYVDPLR